VLGILSVTGANNILLPQLRRRRRRQTVPPLFRFLLAAFLLRARVHNVCVSVNASANPVSADNTPAIVIVCLRATAYAKYWSAASATATTSSIPFIVSTVVTY
jgi:hypothetical protein